MDKLEEKEFKEFIDGFRLECNPSVFDVNKIVKRLYTLQRRVASLEKIADTYHG